MQKVYGPYKRKNDNRLIVILYDTETQKRQTVSYPKWLMEKIIDRKLDKWETVDHRDEDCTNNSIFNLQILTRVENARKSYYHENGKVTSKYVVEFARSEAGRKLSKDRITGEKNPSSQFLDKDVIKFREDFCNGLLTKNDIIRISGASRKAVGNMLNNISYTHLLDK